MDPLSWMMIAALGLLVVFMVRNSRKQRQTQLELQEKLVPGAEVMTSFGLYAELVSIDEDKNIAVLDAGNGTLLRVHRQTLTRVVEEETPVDSSEDAADKPASEKDS